MKHVYAIAFFVLSFSAVEAKTIITFDSWLGNWSDAGNWDLNRVPKNGDSVVIPAFRTVIFNQAQSLSNMGIKVAGIMLIGQTMTLSANSVINLTGAIAALGINRNNELIVLGSVNKLDNKVVSWIWGPGLASSVSGVSPNGFTMSALPVSFTNFYAARANSNVELTWSTAEEINNKEFEIQKSLDGKNWSVAGTVKGAITSNTVQQYRYTDRNVTAAIVYYRIRQVDLNGNYSFSIIKTVKNDKETASVAKIYSVNKSLNIEFNREIKNAVSIRVFSLSGALVSQQREAQSSYRLTTNFSHVQPGVYVVQVSDGADINEVAKVVL